MKFYSSFICHRVQPKDLLIDLNKNMFKTIQNFGAKKTSRNNAYFKFKLKNRVLTNRLSRLNNFVYFLFVFTLMLAPHNISQTNCSVLLEQKSYRQLFDSFSSDAVTPTIAAATPSFAAHHHTMTSESAAKLQEIMMQGLGLSKLPDVKKINISHTEYSEKYNLYLNRIQRSSYDEDELLGSRSSAMPPKRLFSYKELGTKVRKRRFVDVDEYPSLLPSTEVEQFDLNDDLVYLHFQLPTFHQSEANIQSTLDNLLDESTLRVVLKRTSNQRATAASSGFLLIKVYQLHEPYQRLLLDARELWTSDDNELAINWLEFDVSTAVRMWFSNVSKNLGFEIVCDGCTASGWHIVHEVSSYADGDLTELNPMLNLIGRLTREKRSQRHFKHSAPAKLSQKSQKTDCRIGESNTKCCRHRMPVVFRELKGFDFIIQPKSFDAGYCRGRCPPRYNPAHHHAVLQSLVWKQDRSRAPRPCCAPSKLMELEILHVDENDPSKLKVSTWTDMRVLECACS